MDGGHRSGDSTRRRAIFAEPDYLPGFLPASPDEIRRIPLADRSCGVASEDANQRGDGRPVLMRALENRVALVTGANRGIGRGIAEALADDGALLIVHFGQKS